MNSFFYCFPCGKIIVNLRDIYRNVNMEKKLYPFRFIPVASKRPWGGHDLMKKLGKEFFECDEDGNEVRIPADELIGESWEIADMGVVDSVVSEGWLAGNTIGDIMETYLERVVGEDVYKHYGRQFPLLIKFLDINNTLSVQVHPDDEVAAERYDSLGKAEIWYIMDAKPEAKMYCGFNRDTTAQEFYDRCQNGTVDEILNVIYPKKGDVIFITPGTVHAADGGILIAEIQESSDMTFRLYDWGREFDPATARKMHLDEAIDVINYNAFDPSIYRKGPLWGEESQEEDHMIQNLVECPQFNVSKIRLTDPLHIYTEKFESFIVYICLEGAASIQVPSEKENGEACMETYEFKKGETILVPADMPDFFLVPRDRETLLLEAVTRPEEEIDQYIDPDTEAFLEGEDYEGIEDETDEPSAPAGASPLNFFN